MSGSQSTRWEAIDAARGIAMFFVCFAHFGSGYFASIGEPARQTLTDRIGLVASPTFMLISGMMLGMLASARSPARFAPVRDKLIDRGLFLLLVAHPVILIAHLSFDMGRLAWLRWGFITDAIGIALIAGPAIVTRLSSRARLLLAAAMYAASWWLVLAWLPESLPVRFLKDTFVGPMARSTRLFNFPVLPWLAVYIAGSSLGEMLQRRREAGARSAMRLLLVTGSTMLMCAAALHLLLPHSVSDAWSPTGDIFDRVADLASIFQKLPPGPMYLLAFGGIGLMITAGAIWIDARGIAPRALAALALIGKSSLFVFAFQYYLYFVLLRALHLPSIRWWPAYYTVSMTIVYAASRVWMRYDLNRYLTVGYARWRASRALAIRQLSDALAQLIQASHTPTAPPDTIVAAWAELPPSRERASTSTAAR